MLIVYNVWVGRAVQVLVELKGDIDARDHYGKNVYKHAVDRSTQRLLDKMGADHGDYQEPW